MRWTYDTEVHENVYSGQIVSSAAVADVDGERIVFFGGRQDAVRAAGRRRRRCAGGTSCGRTAAARTRPRSSRRPVVVDGLVDPRAGTCTTATPASRPACSRSTPRPARSAGPSAPRRSPERLRRRVGLGLGRRRAPAWCSPARRNCPSSPEGWGRYTEALFALDLDTGEPQLVVPAARAEQRRLRLRRRAEPVRGRGRPRARRARQQGRRLLRGRPRHRRGGVAAQGGRARHHPSAAATSRPAGSSVRPRTRTASSSGAPRSAATRTSTRIDAATGEIRWQQPEAAADLRGLGRGQRRRVHRRHRLHAPRPRPADRRGALAPGDDRRGRRRRGGRRQRRRRGGRHPRAGRRRAEPHERRHAVLARRRAGDPDVDRVDAPRPRPPRRPRPSRRPRRRASARRARSRSTSSSRRRRRRRAPTLEVTLDPWTVTFQAEGLGPPEAWLRPGSQAAAGRRRRLRACSCPNATTTRKEALLCELDEDLTCTLRRGPAPGRDLHPDHAPRHPSRGPGCPSVTEGVDRLVATQAFDEPVQP